MTRSPSAGRKDSPRMGIVLARREFTVPRRGTDAHAFAGAPLQHLQVAAATAVPESFKAPAPSVSQKSMKVMKWSMKTALSVWLGSIAMAFAMKARAESLLVADSSGAPAEIVVTAQKRASTVQETPISISAVSGDELQGRGITDVTSLAQSTPGVSLKSEGPGQTEIEMRGMTASGGNSATVGFYLDDIPLTAPAGAQNGKVVISPTLYDLSRIEVLRGPQGTLYGSGSMGGTVKLVTHQPDLMDFQATAQSVLSGTDGGGLNHNDNFMLNIPLLEGTLALRVVGSEASTSGWIDRIVAYPFPLPSVDGSTRGDVRAAPVEKRYPGSNAEQLYGTRATLLWEPIPELKITPSIFYQTDKQNGVSAFDSDPGTKTRYQPFDVAEPNTDRFVVYSLTGDYSLHAFDVTSITSYWDRTAMQTQDGSENFNNPNTGMTYAANYGLPNPGYYPPTGSGVVYSKEVDPSRQFSEELRAVSTGDGRLNWVGGIFYSKFSSIWYLNGTSDNPSAFMDTGTGLPATSTVMWDVTAPTRIKQYAVFGEGTYAITSQLKANVGLRWYRYDYSFSEIFAGWGSALGAATPSDSGLITQSANGINPKFNLSYDFDRDLMVYATAAKGFRPGGGNAPLPTTGPYWSQVFGAYNYTGTKWPSSYRPDSVWSYEIGDKARFLDRRVTVNASLYFEDWRNIQLESLPGDWPMEINGNRARIFGGELETLAVLGGGFQLAVSGGYTHARVDAGPHWQLTPRDRLSDVPPLTANVNLTYSKQLNETYTFLARLENSYVDPRYSLSFPFGYSTNGKYTLVPSYDLTNIRVGIQSATGWGASLFANNLFNKQAYLENMLQESLPNAAFNRIITNQPLTAGVDITYRF
jgi:iron complex outermembrane receptor protein